MNRFSTEEDRSRVFLTEQDKNKLPSVQQGDWIDLYQLLQISPQASTFELDEAIIERGADTVYFALSRHGKPPYIVQLEKHLPQMRPILLDPAVRKRYDEQLALHRKSDPLRQPYDEFLQTLDLREYSGCLTSVAFLLAPSLFWLACQAAKFVC